MSRESLIVSLGIILAVTPFLGISGDFKRYIFIGGGLLIAVVGYQLRRAAFFRSIQTSNGEKRSDSFVESMPSEDGEISEEENKSPHV